MTQIQGRGAIDRDTTNTHACSLGFPQLLRRIQALGHTVALMSLFGRAVCGWLHSVPETDAGVRAEPGADQTQPAFVLQVPIERIERVCLGN